MVTVSLHSLGSLTKGVTNFDFEVGRDNAMKQSLAFDGALNIRFYELVDVADIVIRLQLNPRKHLKLQEDVGVHSSCGENLDQILGFFYDMLQRLQQLYPDPVVDFVQSIDANRRLRIYIRELNEELLAFCKGQPRRLLPFFLSLFVDINGRL